jgi:long-chain acyl-CoA synthetase
LSNLAHIVFDNVGRIPDAPAILRRGDAGNATYGELGSAISRAAAGLRNSEVSHNDLVAYQISNGSAATILYFAILSVGAIAVPISPLLTNREVSGILTRTEPKRFFSECPNCHPDVHLDGPEDLQGLPQGEDTDEISYRRGSDAAVVFFTSGTTGAPKGVVLTHDNLRTNAEWVSTQSLDGPTWGQGHVSAALLPLSHSFGMTCSQNATLLGGAALTYIPRFNAQEILRQVRHIGVTTMAMVPSAARALLDAWQESQEELPLRYCLIGGAAIPADLIQHIESSWGAKVLEGYGLTETAPVCAFRTPDIPRKTGSIGRAAGHASLAILGDTGETLDEGEGELLVKGPGVTPGYFVSGGPTKGETAPTWFQTGDIARIDQDGDVFILDRIKDIIIHNGYNVYPTEIEAVIKESDAVADAAVIGLPDTLSGEAIVAFVVPAGADIIVDDLSDHCQFALAKYKQPQEFRPVDSIPRGTKGQILRDELRSAILT